MEEESNNPPIFSDEAERQRYVMKLKDRIATWLNRARMAHSRGMDDLVRRALEHRHRCQVELAAIEGTEPPPPDDPDTITGPRGTPPEFPPTQPTGVPRRPLPASGGTDIELPLPDSDEDSDSG